MMTSSPGSKTVCPSVFATKFNASVAPLVNTISFLSFAFMYFWTEVLVFSYMFVAATDK